MHIEGLGDQGCCCWLGRDDISGMFLGVRVVLPVSSCTALPFTTSQAIPPYSQTLHRSQTAQDSPFSGSSTMSGTSPDACVAAPLGLLLSVRHTEGIDHIPCVTWMKVNPPELAVLGTRGQDRAGPCTPRADKRLSLFLTTPGTSMTG